MGGEIVKLVERYGGSIGDSYALALQTRRRPESRLFVESAVHFMAESIALLAGEDQEVFITNPKAGCTMELLAKDFMVEPAFDALRAMYGDDLLMIAYMNTSGRIKALAGETGGAVCTSSNAKKILTWALSQGKKILFVPDRHLGENSAAACGLSDEDIFVLPSPKTTPTHAYVESLSPADRARMDRSQMILWGSFCGVHTVFSAEHVAYWRTRGYRTLVHPESPKTVVDVADGHGSTSYLWHETMKLPAGSSVAIGTEGHFVRNLREQAALRGINVTHMADIPDPAFGSMGCGCATMSRNDPPHLVAILDLMRKGRAPDLNRVLPGDMVNERSGFRDRLKRSERQHIVKHARASLEKMIEIVES